MSPPLELVITTGEPAGIGPEIALAAATQFLAENSTVRITLLGDPSLFKVSERKDSLAWSDRLALEAITLKNPARAGQLDPENAPYVLTLLDHALAGCLSGRFGAMITAPIQKSIINQAGIPFSGHTEYLAQHCHCSQVVMMLCANIPAGILGLVRPSPLRVALATTHLPIQQVAAALDCKTLLNTLNILHQDLQTWFAIDKPRIAVAGLNPHAGEGGYLGQEEITIIAPAILAAQQKGIAVTGPIPADALFNPRNLSEYDVFLAMYHDQGLAPFKFAAFGSGVNVTLGLPIIRTSVDHGTALELAGKGLADASSMVEALRLAFQLAQQRAQNKSHASRS
ncbi:MAG: 4-hydroxythreonine-4-phosphate dehydrogenase PdxA [Polynucleobacter sp.]